MQKLILILVLFVFSISKASERPGEGFDQARDGQWDIKGTIVNDNVGSRQGGNDYGYTHGIDLSLGKDINGLYVEINYSSDLYTKLGGPGYIYVKPNGKSQYDLYFTEQNIVEILVNNINKDELLYWRVGAGWIELNSENGGNILTATGQQKYVHRMVQYFDELAGAKPIYLPDGTGVRSTYEAMAALGIQNEQQFMDAQLRWRNELEIQGVKRGFDDADSVEVKGRSRIFYKENNSKFTFMTGTEVKAKKHNSGTEKSIKGSVGIGKDRWSLELGAEIPLGKSVPENFVTYNTEKETTFSIEFKRKFGRKKRR